MTRSLAPTRPVVLGRVARLLDMLTYKRPAGSAAEKLFVERYITPLGATPDGYGNMWLTIGDAPILWSSHTDTVHRTSGKQRVIYGDNIATSDSGECLGADCTTGVWLMRQMIGAQIPGRYVFHRDEEIGCLGSSYVAQHEAWRLDGIQFAIAFDRKGFGDVITHQYGGRTASDAFATSLADALAPMVYAPSDKGIVTDTHSYAGIVPECTNIAVGYDHAHTDKETQHVGFAVALLKSLLRADFSGLVCSRDPSTFGAWSSDSGDDFSRDGFAPMDLETYVYDNSTIVADFLFQFGYSVDDLRDFGRSQR